MSATCFRPFLPSIILLFFFKTFHTCITIQSGQGTYSIAGFDVVILEDNRVISGMTGGFTLGLLIGLAIFLLLVCFVVTITVVYQRS